VSVRIVLVALAVDTPVTDDDLRAAVEARLDEVYPTDDGYPLVPDAVRSAALSVRAASALAMSAEVGLDGAPDTGLFAPVELDAAWAARNDLASLYDPESDR
jgi:hypothetical protein